jgi:hypothetical protein
MCENDVILALEKNFGVDQQGNLEEKMLEIK